MILSDVVDYEICEYAKFIYNGVYEYMETDIVIGDIPSHVEIKRIYNKKV